MAKILRSAEKDFRDTPGKIEPYKIFTDASRVEKGILPENLNFDFRRLEPDSFSGVYHFHRYSEEVFFMISGAATLRTPDGLETVEAGDLIFFEKGPTGAHQLYNHTDQPCVYIDIRSYIGYDVAEYPDSDKIFLAPSYEIFDKNEQKGYFDGESDIREIWEKLEAER